MMNALVGKLTRLRYAGLFLALCIVSATVYALNTYTVDNKGSKVGFSGEHVGMKFSGVFEKWQADLVLPPHSNPSITASFDLRSAKTGDFTYDTALLEGDWFDVKNHPQGSFVSDSVEMIDGGFKVSGQLTLRGFSKTQTFFLKQTGNKLSANFAINRLDYRIGYDSDPEAEWVGQDIMMILDLETQ